jgi:hypothetical protein
MSEDRLYCPKLPILAFGTISGVERWGFFIQEMQAAWLKLSPQTVKIKNFYFPLGTQNSNCTG